MPPARIPRTVTESVREPKEGMSGKHLAMIRLLPCTICGREPAGFAHHLLKPELGVRGQKQAADRWAVPLCFDHHDECCPNSIHHHGGEETWFAIYGFDGRGLAKGLWASRGNLDRMRATLATHRQLARLKLAQMEHFAL